MCCLKQSLIASFVVYEHEHLNCDLWNKVWRLSLAPQECYVSALLQSSLSSPKLVFNQLQGTMLHSGEETEVQWMDTQKCRYRLQEQRVMPVSDAECLPAGYLQDVQMRPGPLCGFSGSCPQSTCLLTKSQVRAWKTEWKLRTELPHRARRQSAELCASSSGT